MSDRTNNCDKKLIFKNELNRIKLDMLRHVLKYLRIEDGKIISNLQTIEFAIFRIGANSRNIS